MTGAWPATVWEALDRWAEQRPDQVAVWVSGQSLTFRELRTASALFARELVSRGLHAGDRLVIWCPTSLVSLTAFFAAARVRAIFAPLNTRLTYREATAILERLEPRALLVGRATGSSDPVAHANAWISERKTAGGQLPALWREDDVALDTTAWSVRKFIDMARSAKVTLDELEHEPVSAGDDTFLIQMTSGSTAAPKAVLLDQGQCVRMGYELGIRFDMRPGDRYFVCNPIHHVGCTNFGLLTALSHGGAFYSLREFDADAAVTALQENHCTHHHGIEAHYLYELRSPRLKAGAPSVRVSSAHGDYAVRVMEAFGSTTTISVYGSSETTASPFATDHRDPLDVRLTTNGHPLPGVEARIVEHGANQPAGVGTVGELQIRGWCVMRGYFRDAAATAAAIDEEGWYHTGDLASLDANGRLRFAGRAKDFLRVGGENVAAAEIETVLQSHPFVRMAVVVPLPHEILGQVPVAFIVDEEGTPGATVEELVVHCSERLAKFKVPRSMHRLSLDQLPMTGPGKVKKAELQELAHQLAAD